MKHVANRRGFSLLEVMVAVGFFALMLTLILSAEGGVVASNRSAAKLGTAMHLGRCRMTELEEKLLKMGYPEIDEVDSSAVCCDEKETDGYSCDWRVEKIVLPDPPKESTDGGLLSLGGSIADGGLPGLGPNVTGGAGLNLDGGISNLQAMGANILNQYGGTSGASGILQMVFGMVYPSLKPVLEASIRRITVTIKWKDGEKDRDFTLTQFVTNPQRGGLMGQSPFASADGGLPLPGATGTSTGGAAPAGPGGFPGLMPGLPGRGP